MNRLGQLLTAVALLSLVGCESAPTFPDAPAVPLQNPTAPTFSSSGSVIVNEATVSHYQAPNGDEFVSFADTEGNWYRMEALYDSYGRLREFSTWVNGMHLGTDNPTWSGMDRLQHHTSNASYWATTTATASPIDHGMTGGGGGGGDECFPNGCDNMESRGSNIESMAGEDGAFYIYNPCSEQWRNYGLATAEMIFSQVAFGGAILASAHPMGAPAAPWMIGSTMGFLATSAIRWNLSIRALDRCVSPWRYNDQ
jgi:hypothetical protein